MSAPFLRCFDCDRPSLCAVMLNRPCSSWTASYVPNPGPRPPIARSSRIVLELWRRRRRPIARGRITVTRELLEAIEPRPFLESAEETIARAACLTRIFAGKP